MRPIATVLAGAVTASALAVAAAPPAAAVPTTITVTCTGPVTFYGPVGATYLVEFGPDCDTSNLTDDGFVNSRAQDLQALEAGFFAIPEEPDQGGNTWYVYAYYYEPTNGKSGPLTTTLLDTSLDGQATLAPGGTVAWAMGPGWPTGTYPVIWGGEQEPGGASTPDLTPWHQAYARTSQDAACDAGWAPSWAQWPNDGRGGWVCERVTLRYGD